MIRFAIEEDAQALLAIYAYYIDTEITFEYELPTEAEFRKRIRTVLELSLIHISEPTRHVTLSRMPSSA